jgi:hypothetical protein
MNGAVISEEESFVYTMPDLKGEASAVFTATFRLADVAWTTVVEPAEATGEGCIAFPGSGATPANGNLSLLAVAKGAYTFDHWERNGETLGTNEMLTVEVEPLAENESACVFTAVFKTE